ncbi:MAG: hypothetical protein HC910_06120 [Spirulinaceae cyanobacterium SM2_1_0]|nr:hypothetical protein [Spirulinaceae cyanobacterium SM2_1_0]
MTPRSETIISSLFFMTLGLTTVVYVLRGLAIFAFLPGGILWLLFLLSLGTGLLFLAEKMRRF